jgi:hypothetical protein
MKLNTIDNKMTWDIKKSIWDNLLAQCYHYFYFFMFLIGIFIIIFFVCYGKKPKKKMTWSWGEMGDALAQSSKGRKRRPNLKKHENRCRVIMETIFRAPFTSVRPDFLLYKNGKNLELDGYNEQLHVAFEYQGIQHRTFTPHFHKTREDFLLQQERDAFKANVCEERGIHLLRIPDTVPYDELEAYIMAEVKKWYQD